MRVAVYQGNAVNNGAGTYSIGEVEDYSVTLDPTGADEGLTKLTSSNAEDVDVAANTGPAEETPNYSVSDMTSFVNDNAGDIAVLDIFKSLDDMFVGLSSSNLAVSTTGSGLVKDKNLTQLKQLNLKDGCGATTTKKVASLTELMNVTKNKVLLIARITEDDASNSTLKGLIKLLKDQQMLKQVVIQAKVKYTDFVAARNAHQLAKGAVLFIPVIDKSLQSSNLNDYLNSYLQNDEAIAVAFRDKIDHNAVTLAAATAVDNKGLNKIESRISPVFCRQYIDLQSNQRYIPSNNTAPKTLEQILTDQHRPNIIEVDNYPNAVIFNTIMSR